MDSHQLFDQGSAHYAGVRPRYPAMLFDFLASLCSQRQAAWDCACGNGQAATGLARRFEEVQATDISERQIGNAMEHPGVTFSVQPAEATRFHENQFDLVCVAQALHWFDLDRFWPEVKRVLKPAGVFAIWGYTWFTIGAEIDEIFQDKLLKALEPYWAPQNRLLWDHYRDVPFPFEPVDPPPIKLNMAWDLDQLFGYLRSWSAVRKAIEELGEAFFMQAYEAVQEEWGHPKQIKTVHMDFCLLVGRHET